jgi:acetyltransferase-like isoleucine patch superfamily enzyme
MIKVKYNDIHDTVQIGNNVSIECETIKIGKYSRIGNNVKIKCREIEIGEHFFMADGVEIGRGGCTGPNSNVKIGNGVGIFENTIINPSEPIEIGDNCGIGGDVMIWTHGAWLDVLQGFPSDFGPVRIGKNVWLPARSIVLPNVTIGNDVVIGINSIINRDLPSGCFAAGSPCKVIKENVYPKKLTDNQKENLVTNIVNDWFLMHKIKGIRDVRITYNNGKIFLYQEDNESIYNIDNKEMLGHINDVSEDLRDYLRRRGIKIYADRFFKSIESNWINK